MLVLVIFKVMIIFI